MNSFNVTKQPSVASEVIASQGMDRSSPEWDLDSDEIASVTSQDLHDNRPNRWAGTQRTWQRLTAEERRLWQSMEAVEGQDLAIHLYNAYALKRRGRDSQTAQDVTVTLVRFSFINFID